MSDYLVKDFQEHICGKSSYGLNVLPSILMHEAYMRMFSPACP